MLNAQCVCFIGMCMEMEMKAMGSHGNHENPIGMGIMDGHVDGKGNREKEVSSKGIMLEC